MQADQFARGDMVENAPESMRLFSMCQAMKWSHLPIDGGLYAQHPRLLDEWEIIFSAIAKQDQREKEKSKAEAANSRRSKR